MKKKQTKALRNTSKETKKYIYFFRIKKVD